jgi:type IV pilus biogenesis protein PilP
MQRANLPRTIAVFAALTLGVAASHAITPVAADAGAGPVGQEPQPAQSKGLTSNSMQAVGMGKHGGAVALDQSKKPALGTIAELEELQRQTALVEARKRLLEASKSAAEQSTLQGVAPTGIVHVEEPPRAKAAKEGGKSSRPASSESTSAIADFVKPGPLVNGAPSAKLVNLFVVGGRARADVLENGRIRTVKEGDEIDQWTVARIASDGVTVEYRYTVDAPAAPVQPPVVSGLRPSIAEAFPAAYALVNTRRGTEAQELVKSMKLAAASPHEVAAASGTAPVSTAMQPPAIPNLPPAPPANNGMADSASIPPVPPLPPALGG